MTIYSVIVHYNSPGEVIRLVNELFHCTTRKHCIVVVDNQSIPENLNLLKTGTAHFSNFVLLEQPVNGGFGFGVNRAVDYITSREKEAYVHVINSDVEVVNKDYLSHLCSFLDTNPAVSMVGPKVVERDGSTVQNTILPLTSLSSIFNFRNNYSNINRSALAISPAPVDCLNGVCFVIRMSDYNSVKGFDEAYFMYNEEQDLCFKLKSAGKTIYFVPVLSIMHAGGDLHQAEKADWRFMYKRRNIVLYLRTHKTVIQALFIAMVFSVSSIPKFVQNPGGISWFKFVKQLFKAAI